MKKVIYGTPLKFGAFMLCVLSIAFASYLFTSNFIKEEGIYLFEDSYEDSREANWIINEEFYSLSNNLDSTLDENEKLHPEILKNLPSADEMEYLIKVNDKVYSNVKDQNYYDFSNSPISKGIRQKAVDGDKLREGFTNSGNSGGYYFYDTADYYEVCIRMPKAVIEKNTAVWLETKTGADKAVTKIVLLLILAISSFIYLLCVTGKKYGEKAIQLMLIDKMYVEITTALLLFIAIGGSALTVVGTAYLLLEENMVIGNLISAIMVFAVVSLSLLLLLSLVRNLKNGTFLKRSLIARILSALWRTVKRMCKWFVKTISKIKKGILIFFGRNFSGRLVAILLVCFAFVVFVLSVLVSNNAAFIVLLIAFVAVAFIFVLKRLVGFENLKNGIDRIKNGDLNHKITECPDGVIGEMAKNINSIGDGLQKSLENEIRAEKMKSELITNVSHDLKTPLTSIINYADLLSKEKLTPQEANDYVAIVKQKSERLKQLTNDLFDISKVQSGNEDFNIEDIDICLLVNQTMAELNEAIKKSELDFRVTTQDKEMFVRTDGRKMSRVFENLFVNCLKYSMKNTRVYIDITNIENETKIEIKNISGYDMDFDEAEIAERFVRGDSSRSTNGSGLGLAIVKSYVEGCGGSVEIKKDGDLFKVIIRFIK